MCALDRVLNLQKDDVVDVFVWQNTGSAQTISLGYRTFMSISEQPDYEAIVKNLSNQKVECQTKTAGSNITSTGIVANLTFNNLEVGKRYDIRHNLRVDSQTSATTDKDLRVQALIGGSQSVFLGRVKNSSAANYEQLINNAEIIKAEGTSLTLNVLIVTNTRLNSNSQIQVCELPDTVVETSKF
jgi:isochorismate synthase EntC